MEQNPPSIDNFLAEAGRVLSAANEGKLKAALESLQSVLAQLATEMEETAVSIVTDCTPLVEKSVRRDGTVPIKIIQPGWGSSGYYSKNVLERDIPRVFPPGTQMFWNHATPTEDMERPEGDLDSLAGVIVTCPQWQENGAKGPGVYADARVFGGYAETIDEIGEHIGVSIRGSGLHEMGERDGRKGRIITEIKSGRSVDFVTTPGAGGAIVQVFESAGSGKLPNPEMIKQLKEARNIGEWLESRLHLTLTQIADDMFGEGRLNRDERKALSHAIGQALNTYHGTITTNAPQLYQRDIWADAPPIKGINESNTEAAMSDEQLKEAQTQIAALQKEREQDRAVMEAMRERLVLSEARDFVNVALATAQLPDITKNRLSRQLLSNPPVKEGRIDQEIYAKMVETAVTEARAEITAVLGNGKITGMGSTAATPQLPKLEESQKRTGAALGRLGYGGAANGN